MLHRSKLVATEVETCPRYAVKGKNKLLSNPGRSHLFLGREGGEVGRAGGGLKGEAKPLTSYEHQGRI